MDSKNLAQILSIFNRHRWPAIAVFSSVIVGAISYVILTPRLYQSTARLMLNERPAVSVSELGRDISQQLGTGAIPLATQEELIGSKNILEAALLTYEQQGGQQFEPPLSIANIDDGLEVSAIPGTLILQIKLESIDPELSAKFLNIIVQEVIKDNTESIRLEASNTRQFLERQVPQKRLQLAQVESQISQFKQSYGFLSFAGDSGDGTTTSESNRLLVQSLATLEDQNREITSQLREVNARNNSLRTVTNAGGIEGTYQAVRGGQDPDLQKVRANLIDLDSQIASRRVYLTETHPEMVELVQERDQIRSLYTQQLSQITGSGLDTTTPETVAADKASQDLSVQLIQGEIEQRSLQEKLNSVSNSIAQLEVRREQYPILEKTFAKMERKRQTLADAVKLLELKLNEASIAEAQLVSNLRVITLAEPSEIASWPKLPVVLVLSTAAGAVLMIGTVLLLELLDRKLHTASEIEKLIQFPVLSVLPRLPEAALDLQFPEHFFNSPALVEAYRALLKSIEFRFLDKLPVLIISSTISGEGKSVVSSHLAAVAAMLSRRTLIIDADLRRPTQHKQFNLSIQSGLTDIIVGDVSLAEAAKQTEITNLSVLTAGSSHIYPSRFFESEGIHTLLEQAAHGYDLVIVDTPPLTGCVDALALSRDKNKLLLVARPNFTDKDLLQQSVAELTDSGISILGVAVNGMAAERDRYYRYKLQNYPSTASALK